MPPPINPNDPRAIRTRHLLLHAFTEMVEIKGNLHSISVQDITERATVNRATFYAHFEDKYALLEAWMRHKFHRTLERVLPNTSPLTPDNLFSLIKAVFDFLNQFRSYQRSGDMKYEPLFEVTMQQEVYEVLLKWLTQNLTLPQVEIETTAQVFSWAIFGPAAQWSRAAQKRSLEDMVSQVFTIVSAGLPAFDMSLKI